ncbi:MAG: tRNA lysidine(34) synthetase TilS [bacterium]|nr:tRNA lysidine(34) synthetase TilS [bacterium]
MTTDRNPTALPARALPEFARLLRAAAGPDLDHEAGPGVLVALSGGADSTALLRLAVLHRERSGAPVEAAHLDHALRGAEAEADADFCRELCRGLDVPLHLRREDPRPLAMVRGRGLEEAARALRREFLAVVLDARPSLAACATGHHRDDQAETVLIRLFRGTGPEGLQGIQPRAGRFIHPLLGCGRDEIEAWLAALGQPWRRDATNDDASNVRGRVRRELLPLARDIFGAGAAASPARLASLLRDDAAELEAQAAAALRALRRGRRDGALPADALAALPGPLASRALRRHLRGECGLDLDRVHVARLLDWLRAGRSGAAVDLTGGWRARRDFDRLVFDPPTAMPGPPAAAAVLTVRAATPAEAAARDPEPACPLPPPGGWRLTCPASALRGEPRVRPWRPGDRLAPFGMAGRRKVGDLLQQLRVPLPERARTLVAEDDAGPFWVVGLVRDERTRLLPTTPDAVTLLVRYAGEETGGTTRP